MSATIAKPFELTPQEPSYATEGRRALGEQARLLGRAPGVGNRCRCRAYAKTLALAKADLPIGEATQVMAMSHG